LSLSLPYTEQDNTEHQVASSSCCHQSNHPSPHLMRSRTPPNNKLRRPRATTKKVVLSSIVCVFSSLLHAEGSPPIKLLSSLLSRGDRHQTSRPRTCLSTEHVATNLAISSLLQRGRSPPNKSSRSHLRGRADTEQAVLSHTSYRVGRQIPSRLHPAMGETDINQAVLTPALSGQTTQSSCSRPYYRERLPPINLFLPPL